MRQYHITPTLADDIISSAIERGADISGWRLAWVVRCDSWSPAPTWNDSRSYHSIEKVVFEEDHNGNEWFSRVTVQLLLDCTRGERPFIQAVAVEVYRTAQFGNCWKSDRYILSREDTQRLAYPLLHELRLLEEEQPSVAKKPHSVLLCGFFVMQSLYTIQKTQNIQNILSSILHLIAYNSKCIQRCKH